MQSSLTDTRVKSSEDDQRKKYDMERRRTRAVERTYIQIK